MHHIPSGRGVGFDGSGLLRHGDGNLHCHSMAADMGGAILGECASRSWSSRVRRGGSWVVVCGNDVDVGGVI